MTLKIEEILIFRALKRASLVLMLILRLNKPVGETEIADILNIDTKTARVHLRSLSAIGLINRTHFHNGYILTKLGRQFILPISQLGVSLGSNETRDDPEGSPASLGYGGTTPPSGDDELVVAVHSRGSATQDCRAGGLDGDSIAHRTNLAVNPGNSPDLPVVINNKESLKESFNESIITKKNSGFNPGKTPGSDNPDEPDTEVITEIIDVQPLIDSLARHGIMMNQRTERLLLTVTQEDIDSVYHELRRSGQAHMTGLFIYMLEQRSQSDLLRNIEHTENGMTIFTDAPHWRSYCLEWDDFIVQDDDKDESDEKVQEGKKENKNDKSAKKT